MRFFPLRLERRLILPQAQQVVWYAAAAVIPEPDERRLGVGKGSNFPISARGWEGPGSAHRARSGRLPNPVDADPVVRWKGSASETTMTTEHFIPARQRAPRNRGRLIGQKRPLKLKDVWTSRVKLQMEGRRRDLAMFDVAIDSELRGCDVVAAWPLEGGEHRALIRDRG